MMWHRESTCPGAFIVRILPVGIPGRALASPRRHSGYAEVYYDGRWWDIPEEVRPVAKAMLIAFNMQEDRLGTRSRAGGARALGQVTPPGLVCSWLAHESAIDRGGLA